MRRRILVAGILALFCLPTLLAGEETAVEAAERAWAVAVVANDFKALDAILADDLYYSHSNFVEDTKSSFLDGLKSGRMRYFGIKIESLKVKVLDGKTALVMAVSQFETKAPDGSKQESTLKTLHVFRKHGGNWQLVAHQSAKKPQ